MNTHIQDLIRYRVQRVKEVLNDAKIPASAGSWNSCVNRLYYSCFYMVTALLLCKGLSSSKHTGVRSLYNNHILKMEIIPKPIGKVYNMLFEFRQEGDYVDFKEFNSEDVTPLISKTEEFLQTIRTVLHNVDTSFSDL